MRKPHPLAVGIAAAVLISSTALAAPAFAAGVRVVGAACGSSGGVTVVVDYTPVIQTVDVRCAPAGATIGDAFTAAGFKLESLAYPGMVDVVDGVHAAWDNATAPAYWSVWTSTANGQPSGAAATEWTMGQVGVAAGPVHDGQAYLLEYQPLDPATMGELKAAPVVPLADILGNVKPAPVAPPAYGPGSADVQAAAGWLGRQLAANGNVLPYNGATDWGLTVDALLALASAGVGGDQIAATAAKLAASGDAYVGPSAQASANAVKIAKTAFGLEVAGLDPTHFGKRDLLAELRGTVGSSGAIGAPATAVTQSYGLLALARSGGGAPAIAISWLQAQQCASGPNAGAYGWSASCDSADADTTALAAQALLAAGVPASDPSVRAAKAWLISAQEAGGGIASSMGGVNTNTTGIAAQLLRGVADTSDTAAQHTLTAAVGYVGGLQVTCAVVTAHPKLKPADAGAFAYDAAGLADATTYGVDALSVDQFRRATAQALLGLGGPLLGNLTTAGATAALPAAPCATPPTPKPTDPATTKPKAATAKPKVTGPSVETGGTVGGQPWLAGALFALVLAVVAWRKANA